jgi:hypothetical protein
MRYLQLEVEQKISHPQGGFTRISFGIDEFGAEAEYVWVVYEYIYVDRDVTVRGYYYYGDGPKCTVDFDMKKGWNKIKTIVTGDEIKKMSGEQGTWVHRGSFPLRVNAVTDYNAVDFIPFPW